MSVLSLFRKDRRQRDPFTALPETGPAGPATAPIPLSWTPEVERQLAGIVAQAEAERAAHAEDWYGLTELDVPPVHDRPYVAAAPALASPPPPMPFSGVSRIWVGQVRYPVPGDLSYDQARNYRETLRHIGAATGTSTWLERADAWPLLAIEAPKGMAA